jgi:predicted transcriptional regulator of viral defense system
MVFEAFAKQMRPFGNLFDSSLALPFYASPQQAQRQLSDWTRSGDLLQLRRGIYAFPPPYEYEDPHRYRIANRLVRPSYVSLQSALSYYGLIPEHVASLTSVTTDRPIKLRNEFGRFMYRHIKTEFFYGFRYRQISNSQSAFIATPEKALLDLIYLTPHADKEAYLQTLRLQNLEVLNTERLHRLVERANQPKLRRAFSHLLTIIEEEADTYLSL